MKNRYFFLFLSALLYGFSFLFNRYCSFLIVLSPLFLLCAASQAPLSFKEGFMWGLCVSALSGFGFVVVIAHMAQQCWFGGLCLGIVITIYYASIAASFFGAARAIIMRCKDYLSPFVKLFIATIFFFWFIIFVDRYSLIVFGIFQGYPLMHPLVALADSGVLLFFVSLWGKDGALVCFLLLSLCLTQILLLGRLRIFCVLCFVVFSFLSVLSLFQQKHYQRMDSIVTLPYMIYGSNRSAKSMIKVVAQWLRKVIQEYSHVQTIIMPESSLNTIFMQEDYDDFVCWSSESSGKPIQLIFGATRLSGDCYYNTVFCVKNGTLESFFDKRCPMLLSEWLPDWCGMVSLQTICRNADRPAITWSDNKRNAIIINGYGECVPYICSELFCSVSPDSSDQGRPIVALVNDSIFIESPCAGYIADFLVKLARLKAADWGCDIIYVSYSQSLLLEKNGLVNSLQRL